MTEKEKSDFLYEISHQKYGFEVGDKVRLEDGDGRCHIIKSFERVEGVHGPDFFIVHFEDNAATGFLVENYCDMVKM